MAKGHDRVFCDCVLSPYRYHHESHSLNCAVVLPLCCCGCRSQTVPYISFMGTNLPNHSYIDLTQVGEDSDSVQCHTDLTTCCSEDQGPHHGDWYFPNETRLQCDSFTINRLYEDHRAQQVDLSVYGSPTPPEGIYRCDIETSATSNDSRESAYVGLYQHNRGQYTIS